MWVLRPTGWWAKLITRISEARKPLLTGQVIRTGLNLRDDLVFAEGMNEGMTDKVKLNGELRFLLVLPLDNDFPFRREKLRFLSAH